MQGNKKPTINYDNGFHFFRVNEAIIMPCARLPHQSIVPHAPDIDS